MAVTDKVKAYKAAIEARNVAARDAVEGRQSYTADNGVQLVQNPLTGDFVPLDSLIPAKPTPEQFGIRSIGSTLGWDGNNVWHELFVDLSDGSVSDDQPRLVPAAAGETQAQLINRLAGGVAASAFSQAQWNQQHAYASDGIPGFVINLGIAAGMAAIGNFALAGVTEAIGAASGAADTITQALNLGSENAGIVDQSGFVSKLGASLAAPASPVLDYFSAPDDVRAAFNLGGENAGVVDQSGEVSKLGHSLSAGAPGAVIVPDDVQAALNLGGENAGIVDQSGEVSKLGLSLAAGGGPVFSLSSLIPNPGQVKQAAGVASSIAAAVKGAQQALSNLVKPAAAPAQAAGAAAPAAGLAALPQSLKLAALGVAALGAVALFKGHAA